MKNEKEDEEKNEAQCLPFLISLFCSVCISSSINQSINQSLASLKSVEKRKKKTLVIPCMHFHSYLSLFF